MHVEGFWRPLRAELRCVIFRHHSLVLSVLAVVELAQCVGDHARLSQRASGRDLTP